MQTPYQQQPVPPPHPKSNKAIIAVIWVLTVVGAFFGGREFLRWELRRTLEDAFSGLATNDTPLPFSEPADNDGIEEQPVAREKVTATPLELVKYFDENPVAALDWIKNKTIVITAPISHVSNNMFGGDRVAVVYKANLGTYLDPTVVFWFDAEFRSAIGQLRDGQTVTCEGTFVEEEFGGDLKFKGTAVD